MTLAHPNTHLTFGEVREALFSATQMMMSESAPPGLLEQTLVGRILANLDPIVRSWNFPGDDPFIVDIEYGRAGRDPKRRETGGVARVDLIVHQRDVRDGNLLALEVKRSVNTTSPAIDYMHVEWLTAPLVPLNGDQPVRGYRIGAVMVTYDRVRVDVRWIRDHAYQHEDWYAQQPIPAWQPVPGLPLLTDTIWP